MKIIEVHETQTTLIVSESHKPPRIKPKIKGIPRIRQLYWCDLPKDAQLPEFWKTRAVLIVSHKHTFYGTVTVLPCSGQEQPGNKWAYRLPRTIDGRPSWAICDKPMSLAVSRLSPEKSGIVRLTEAEFKPALDMMLTWLTPGKTIQNPA